MFILKLKQLTQKITIFYPKQSSFWLKFQSKKNLVVTIPSGQRNFMRRTQSKMKHLARKRAVATRKRPVCKICSVEEKEEERKWMRFYAGPSGIALDFSGMLKVFGRIDLTTLMRYKSSPSKSAFWSIKL